MPLLRIQSLRHEQGQYVIEERSSPELNSIDSDLPEGYFSHVRVSLFDFE